MTILQMRCFVSLVTTKKFMETANLFGLQASTLSKYLDHIEDSFSVKLFRKTQNGLELTKEGELIYPSIQFIVKKYDDLMIHLNRLTNMDRTTMNVALAFHQSQILMLLIEFSRNYPDINLSILEAPSSEIRARLDASNIDIAVTYEELLGKKYPHTFPIRKDKLIAVVGHNHPLAGRGIISVSELKNDTFFLFRGDNFMYRFQIHTCIAAGFTPTESPHDFRVNTIMDYVSRNRGVSLLVENAVNSLNNKNVAILSLHENPMLTMSMVFPSPYLPENCEKLVKFQKSHNLYDVPITI